MRRPVRWSTDALADLSDQLAYIASENPSAARRVADALDRTALALGDMPTGRAGRVTRTYEKSVTGLSYVIAYALMLQGGVEAVAIVRVIHTSRD
ncbi:type II toxin-antitoxin system RelE/ParE family toxin [Loktanella salsilacus]|uniref:type II toxin-antitoxin system RelE/ParE family toxin n=1 Tax=Loktanella salsilacus TaxID=195913 RepID=UPI0020B676E9|nr:type II toxin-antitoxin system RelE/ParE family toxin [Loktanella salsilacus]UTH46292.1 type II toxin-antitoxin system RelE/ParE family toxin [Loktanella salsilacus]